MERGKETPTHHFFMFMETALGLSLVLEAGSQLLSLQADFEDREASKFEACRASNKENLPTL